MCGLVGTAGKLTVTTDKQFKILLTLDAIRGIDSTGIAAVNRSGDVKVVKQIGNPYDLFNYKLFDNAVNQMNKVLIGHNRFATQGLVNRKNAHPFEFETLVGVHNGTLWNRHKLKDSHNFTVDSENLFHHIEKEGLRSFLDVATGAWSLVWWDKITDTLNFLRNKERPMWFATSKDDSLLFWASEPWMLEVAIDRENTPFNQPISTQVDTHYSFHIDSQGVISKPRLFQAAAKEEKAENFPRGGKVEHSKPPLLPEQPKNTVIDINKLFPKGKQVVSTDNNFYVGQKEVLLECLAEKTDKRGSRYIICFDPKNRGANIRLYLKREDKSDTFVYKDIIATIGHKYADGSEGLYYKVEHSTVKLANVPFMSSANDEGNYFLDGKGVLISKKDWNLKYHRGCAWCTATVFPEEANKFTKGGEIICPDCASDSEINKYVEMQ